MSNDLPVHDLQVVEVEDHGPARPQLLVEIPHAADSMAHFQTVRSHLRSRLPDRLEEFFFVNTDVGTTAVARAVAERLAERGLGTRIVRCLVPRTFVDCNRDLSVGPDVRTDDGLTPAIPGYVQAPEDRAWLGDLHRRYHRVASSAYEEIVGRGGRCINLHTYAPRTVQLGVIGNDIVTALRRAYEPDAFEGWPLRPEVDLITETPEGLLLGDAAWLRRVREEYEAIGVGVEENGAYRLIPDTMGRVYAERYPGRLLCVEVRRDLLADPYDPFVEMKISGEKASRMARPLADSLVPD
ncbi:MAG: N-formylglutamate amidohydrolase [Thermoanaerobaculia bacterium]|nr:N-formylglutamate amidohydrolase [Thermoanaerobaculia bacterium]